MTAAATGVLLAEDDPDDRFLIVRALQRVRPQLRVTAVADGVELLAHLRGCVLDQLPQLLLLDLNMPRMDGREVLAHLRADPRLSRIPVVVLSTSVEPEDRARVRAAHAADFLSKPDEFSAMVSLLRSLLTDKLGAETERPAC